MPPCEAQCRTAQQCPCRCQGFAASAARALLSWQWQYAAATYSAPHTIKPCCANGETGGLRDITGGPAGGLADVRDAEGVTGGLGDITGGETGWLADIQGGRVAGLADIGGDQR